METEEEWKVELETFITKMMLELGIPAHLRGYRYVREAITMVEIDMELVGSVTKLLYPELSKKFDASDQRIERAIRNAIEVSWERGNPKLFEELFGYSMHTGTKRPTNSEYLARVADKVRLDFKKQM